MRVVGVAKARPDFEAKMAIRKGFALYAANADAGTKFEKAGVKVSGALDDLVRAADLVVDCTPEDSGYKPLYEKAGIKAIWQVGEEHSLTNLSFNAAANYEECLGAKFVLVPSCNTTGLIRTLYPLDVQSVLPKLNIHTIALKVPTTIMHVHALAVDLKRATTEDAVLEVWKRFPRVAFVSGADGVRSTAQIMELARDLSRNRADLYEIAVWRDGVHVTGGKRLFYFQAVHQESDVVPENIDAIRSMLEIQKDGRKSMEKTDQSLGIGIVK